MQSTSASFPCWLSLCRRDLPRRSSFFYLFILKLKCVKICKFYVIIESIELNELHFIVFLIGWRKPDSDGGSVLRVFLISYGES